MKNGPNPAFQGLRTPEASGRKHLKWPKTRLKRLLHTYKHIVVARPYAKCAKMVITDRKIGLEITQK